MAKAPINQKPPPKSTPQTSNANSFMTATFEQVLKRGYLTERLSQIGFDGFNQTANSVTNSLV